MSEQSTSYAAMAALPPSPPDDGRLEKLEYLSSEELQRKRLLQMTITHPAIDSSNENLDTHVQSFLRLKMNDRAIDKNLNAFECPRNNTVRIELSDVRFKRFLFKARKDLRNNHPECYEGMFINENLTSFNFELMKKLKVELERRKNEQMLNYESVYSFDGKIFVKISKTDDRNAAIHISNQIFLKNLCAN